MFWPCAQTITSAKLIEQRGKNFTLVQISSKVFHDVKDQHGPEPKQWYEIGVHTPAAHRVQSPAARASSCSSLHTCRTFDRRLRRPRPFQIGAVLSLSPAGIGKAGLLHGIGSPPCNSSKPREILGPCTRQSAPIVLSYALVVVVFFFPPFFFRPSTKANTSTQLILTRA